MRFPVALVFFLGGAVLRGSAVRCGYQVRIRGMEDLGETLKVCCEKSELINEGGGVVGSRIEKVRYN